MQYLPNEGTSDSLHVNQTRPIGMHHGREAGRIEARQRVDLPYIILMWNKTWASTVELPGYHRMAEATIRPDGTPQPAGGTSRPDCDPAAAGTPGGMQTSEANRQRPTATARLSTAITNAHDRHKRRKTPASRARPNGNCVRRQRRQEPDGSRKLTKRKHRQQNFPGFVWCFKGFFLFL